MVIAMRRRCGSPDFAALSRMLEVTLIAWNNRQLGTRASFTNGSNATLQETQVYTVW